ncbi:RC-LH1 core complex protein PufX [Jannaschia donghaensis]|uniref:Intrinsic membrane protein PufX n=1 Tax=Jannaschia donghaensis TaxID=420998 RepID=A0A0M6YCJ2_9RHOB|nr:RC-LH1 core complex protein PufX [Jannaschia donghaensis]CTQ48068.1 Intrinsic membrane protein PufX [Jannaschia donghaensis]
MAEHDYLSAGGTPESRLYGDITLLMLKGAGYAAVFSLSVVLFVAFFAWVGGLLPEESQDQPDPNPPRSSLEVPGDRVFT